MGKSYWKVRKGVYAGFTKTGKRFMGQMTAEQARLKSGGSKSRTTKSKTTTKTKRRVKRTAKRKGRGGGKSLQRTIFKWLRVGALVAPGVIRAAAQGPWDKKLHAGVLGYAGINMDGKFDSRVLLNCWTPFLAVTAMTYGIPKIANILRRL